MPFEARWHTLLDRCEEFDGGTEIATPLSDDQFRVTDVQDHRIVVESSDTGETRPLQREQFETLHRRNQDADGAFDHQDDIADIDPDAYFDAYRDRLEPFLSDQTGRTHYRTVIGHLERMAEIDADRELSSFVDRLKEKHSNRPAFLDELEKAGF
jgi:hypothetical protein